MVQKPDFLVDIKTDKWPLYIENLLINLHRFLITKDMHFNNSTQDPVSDIAYLPCKTSLEAKATQHQSVNNPNQRRSQEFVMGVSLTIRETGGALQAPPAESGAEPKGPTHFRAFEIKFGLFWQYI